MEQLYILFDSKAKTYYKHGVGFKVDNTEDDHPAFAQPALLEFDDVIKILILYKRTYLSKNIPEYFFNLNIIPIIINKADIISAIYFMDKVK